MIANEREPGKVRPSVAATLRQRIFALACGHEDDNDFDELRSDPAFKPAVGWLPDGEPELTSPPACRGRRPRGGEVTQSSHSTA